MNPMKSRNKATHMKLTPKFFPSDASAHGQTGSYPIEMATYSHMTGFISRCTEDVLTAESTKATRGLKSPAEKLDEIITFLSRLAHLPRRFSLCDTARKTPHPFENKLAEACASRTHPRHQGCRPPVLKLTK